MLKQKNKFNFHLFINSALGCALFLSSCRSGDIKGPNDRPLPKGYVTPEIVTLTEAGSNLRGAQTPSGDKIYFISLGRHKHPHPQVYEFDTTTKKDRRITYQDGQIYDVVFDSKSNRIIYSSSTDEIKENPEFIRQALAEKQGSISAKIEWKNFKNENLPATEIYSSSTDGRDIQRLTESPGFDGMIALHPNKTEIAFVSVRDQQKRIWRMNLKTRGLTVVSQKTIGVEDESPSYSPDGLRLTWVRKLAPNVSSDLWVDQLKNSAPQMLLTESRLILTPTWAPGSDEIVFSSNRDELENFELYAIKADGTCLRRLTYHSASDFDPSFNAKGDQLLFTRILQGQPQLVTMPYLPPPCPEAPAPVQ